MMSERSGGARVCGAPVCGVARVVYTSGGGGVRGRVAGRARAHTHLHT